MKELTHLNSEDITDEIYQEILRLRANGESAALATVIRTKGSTPGKPLFRMLIYSDSQILGTVGGGTFEAKVISEALKVISSQKPKIINFNFFESEDTIIDEQPICGGKMEAFIEPIIVKPALYIMGAGHVGFAIAKIGKIAGFRVIVVDDREEFANRERFSFVDEIILLDFNRIADEIKVNQSSYIVIVTRGHLYDKIVLKAFIRGQVGYLGMIGSKIKVNEIFQRLLDEGIDKELLERVHAPIGLDIGSKTPAEIAVSIMAEIIACYRGKKGSILAMRDKKLVV
jgi:xanthine dehydrogenase accessory factor